MDAGQAKLRRMGDHVLPLRTRANARDPGLRVDLDLELVEGCLSGRARNDSGPVRAFSGWLGMVGALGALLPETFAPSDKAFPTPPQESP